jgi:UDPglucose--hexose-1-phosphate uridylyltransferase
VCPRAGRVPYETLLAPVEAEDDPWTSDRLGPALRALADVVRRLHELGGPVPLNAWLHAGPWWHIELFPRLTVLAGIELGAGIYVNTVAPEEAAQNLRNENGRP